MAGIGVGNTTKIHTKPTIKKAPSKVAKNRMNRKAGSSSFLIIDLDYAKLGVCLARVEYGG